MSIYYVVKLVYFALIGLFCSNLQIIFYYVVKLVYFALIGLFCSNLQIIYNKIFLFLVHVIIKNKIKNSAFKNTKNILKASCPNSR